MALLENRWFAYFAGALFVCLAFILAATKAPWCDEGWFANAAYNLANHGHMGSSLQEPSGHYLNAYLRGIQERTYIVPPVYLVTLAGWLKVFGNSLAAMRSYATLWGLVGLAAGAWLVLQLTRDRRLTFLFAGLMAIDFTFLFASTDVRMETMVIALSLLSWTVYLAWREQHLARAILASHTLLALACFCHPNAALMGVGWIYLFYRLDRHRFRWSLLALSTVPYLILAAAWGVYIQESPLDFRAQFFANAGDASRFKFLFQPWMNLGLELGLRYWGHYGGYPIWAYPMPLFMLLIPAFYFAALLGCFRHRHLRHHLGELWPLALSVIGLLTFAMSFKAQNYLIYTIPFWNLLLAVWLLYGLERRRATVYLAVFAALQLGGVVHRAVRNPLGHEYAQAAEVMRHQLREGHSVIAPSSMAFAAGFAGFIDDARLGRWSGQRADVLVVDRWYRLFHEAYGNREPASSRYVKHLLGDEYTEFSRFGDYTIYTRKHLSAHQETP